MFHRTSKFLNHNILRTFYANHCCFFSLTRQAYIPHRYIINSFRNHQQCINHLHGKLLSRRIPMISNLKAFGLSAHHEAKTRNEDNINPRRDVFAQFDDVFRSCSKRSMSEWEGIASAGVETGLASKVCDALILKKCIDAGNYSLGNSYMEFVEQHQQREPTAGCLAVYMDLCTLDYQECGELPILSAFDRLSSLLSIFPTGLALRATLALSRTSRWREGLPHIEDIRRRGDKVPTSVLADMSRAAFENGDGDVGWDMLEQACRKRYSNLAELFRAFDHYCNSLSHEDCDAAVRRLLGLAGLWQVYPDAASAEELAAALGRRGWSVQDTRIGRGGQCQRCGESLKHEPFTEDSFLKLKEEIVERVLKREDIFQVTSPEEFAKFNKVVESNGPFTHLLDGLNIAFTRGGSGRQRLDNNKSMAESILKIIDDILYASPKANIFVIARAHMQRWHRPTMMQIHMNATVFYLQNVTLDDSYILYAALHSGPDTKIVTNIWSKLRRHPE